MRFGGRSYLCATEHLRGATPDEADRLGIDERRQLDELPRAAREVPEYYEDLTSQPGPRHQWKFRQNHQGDPRSRHAMTWISAWTQLGKLLPLGGARETASSKEIGGQSTFVEDVERVLDSRLWPNFFYYGETAENPQFKRARLEEPLDDEQEKTAEDETELISLEEAVVMKSRGSSTGSSILDKCQPDREISFHQLPEGNVSLVQRSGTCSTGRVGEEPRVIHLVDNPREVEEAYS